MTARDYSNAKINEQIIRFVKEHPALYDAECPEFKNQFMKNHLWEEFGGKFGKSGEEIKGKWKNLRDTYCKYLRSLSDSQQYRYNKWQWAQAMEFLREHLAISTDIPNNDTEGDVRLKADQIYQGESSNQSTVSQKKRPKKYRTVEVWHGNEKANRRASKGDKDLERDANDSQDDSGNQSSRPKLKKLKQIGKLYSVNETAHNLSATENIMMGYASIIDRFSVRRRIETKMKIAKVIMEAELAEEEERLGQNFEEDNYEMDPFKETQPQTLIFKVEEDNLE